MVQSVHRIVHGAARLMALLGGLVLVAVILMVCVSILGRTVSGLLNAPTVQAVAPQLAEWLLALGIGPVRGDFELVEAGMAFCVFAFLGWCQITAGHASVDLFTARLPARVRRALAAVIEFAFAAALVLIAVQLFDGMDTQMRRRSTTFLLQYPLWWNYAAAVVPASLAALVAIHMALVRVAEAATGRALIDVGRGSDT